MHKSTKLATSFRLTIEAIKMLKVMSKRLGVNRTSVIELAIRTLDRKGRE